MENPRSSLIKKILSEGPLPVHELYEALQQKFPQQFGSVTTSQLKRVYLTSLKNLKHIKPRRCIDPEIVARYKSSILNNSCNVKKQDTVWRWTLSDKLLQKYKDLSYEELTTTTAPMILKDIDMEKQKSIDFWKGRTTTPHDWKASLEKMGKKTHI
ncbi:hypothetical protein BB561_001784 [Smittium simulii]|uniref:Uncharacterized protein n=1 Tax=Smittium simulii TaxID=133385 RepID=A0A2T9YT15_9FUNG|nr:hypothetical protein BB561_001784 [Smittium simulii]